MIKKKRKKEMKTRTFNEINKPNWLKQGEIYFIHIIMNLNNILIVNWQKKKEKY